MDPAIPSGGILWQSATTRTETDLFAMTDSPPVFNNASLAGACFTDVNLQAAVFDDVNLGGAAFTNVALGGARFADTSFRDATLDGCDVEGMRIDGLLVTDLLRACRQRDQADRRS